LEITGLSIDKFKIGKVPRSGIDDYLVKVMVICNWKLGAVLGAYGSDYKYK